MLPTNDDIDDLPGDLEYMARFVSAIEDRASNSDLHDYVSQLSGAQVQQWRDLEALMREKDHFTAINAFSQSCPNRRLALLLARFLSVFDDLAGMTEEDIIQRLLDSPPDYGTPDWTRLPAGFDYLIAPSEKYGLFNSEATQLHQIDRFTDRDFETLEELAERMRADNAPEILGRWFDEGSDNFEARRELQMVESLISVMTLCDISYE